MREEAAGAGGDPGWDVDERAAVVMLGGLGAGLGDWRIVAAAIVLGWGWAALTAARLRSIYAPALPSAS